jgi:hypothetical protein
MAEIIGFPQRNASDTPNIPIQNHHGSISAEQRVRRLRNFSIQPPEFIGRM